ncbi:MAG TPA: terminase small subunit [Caulobacteraceae bacterium]
MSGSAGAGDGDTNRSTPGRNKYCGVQSYNMKHKRTTTAPKLGRLTPMQELFCREVAKGAEGGEAHVAAGYKAKYPKGAAKKLLEMAKIQARIAELVASGFGSLTPIQLILRLRQIADSAESLRSAAALAVARTALMDIARLNSLVRPDETQEGATKIMVLADRPLSEDEWESLHPPLG